MSCYCDGVGSCTKRKRIYLSIHSIHCSTHSESVEYHVEAHGAESQPPSPHLVPDIDKVEGKGEQEHEKSHQRKRAEHQIPSPSPVDQEEHHNGECHLDSVNGERKK